MVLRALGLIFSKIDRFKDLEGRHLKITRVDINDNVGFIRVTSRVIFKTGNQYKETLIYIHITYTRNTDGTFMTHQVTDCISEFGSWHR